MDTQPAKHIPAFDMVLLHKCCFHRMNPNPLARYF